MSDKVIQALLALTEEDVVTFSSTLKDVIHENAMVELETLRMTVLEAKDDDEESEDEEDDDDDSEDDTDGDDDDSEDDEEDE